MSHQDDLHERARIDAHSELAETNSELKAELKAAHLRNAKVLAMVMKQVLSPILAGPLFEEEMEPHVASIWKEIDRAVKEAIETFPEARRKAAEFNAHMDSASAELDKTLDELEKEGPKASPLPCDEPKVEKGTCEHCNGSGRMTGDNRGTSGQPPPCPACNGTGILPSPPQL